MLERAVGLFSNISVSITIGADFKAGTKQRLVDAITRGGGELHESILELTASGSLLKILVAALPCRTKKYMMALGLGVPIVSYKW